MIFNRPVVTGGISPQERDAGEPSSCQHFNQEPQQTFISKLLLVSILRTVGTMGCEQRKAL